MWDKLFEQLGETGADIYNNVELKVESAMFQNHNPIVSTVAEVKHNHADVNSDDLSDMLFDLNDVIKVLQCHSVNEEMLSDYASDQLSESMTKTLFDLPKDFEGTQFTIGDCLETVRNHVRIMLEPADTTIYVETSQQYADRISKLNMRGVSDA